MFSHKLNDNNNLRSSVVSFTFKKRSSVPSPTKTKSPCILSIFVCSISLSVFLLSENSNFFIFGNIYALSPLLSFPIIFINPPCERFCFPGNQEYLSDIFSRS